MTPQGDNTGAPQGDDDDALLAFYNRELLDLAALGEGDRRLDAAPRVFSARAVSPICGSIVDLDLEIDAHGRVAAVGFASESCALTRAVLGVLSKAAVGKTRAELAAAAQGLEAMLDGGAAPKGDFERLAVLQPLKDYRARHNAIMLPFEAAEKIFLALTP